MQSLFFYLPNKGQEGDACTDCTGDACTDCTGDACTGCTVPLVVQCTQAEEPEQRYIRSKKQQRNSLIMASTFEISNLYIFLSNKIHSLKFGCKDTGIIKSEFVAKDSNPLWTEHDKLPPTLIF